MKLERRIKSEIREENKEQLINEQKQHKEQVETIQQKMLHERDNYEMRYPFQSFLIINLNVII